MFKKKEDENLDKTVAGIEAANAKRAGKEKPVDDAAAEEAVKEKKKNARAATAGKQKADAKAAGDALLLKMAKDMPVGEGKSFITKNIELDKLDSQAEAIRIARKTVRGDLTKAKVDLKALDRVRRLRKMDPGDVTAMKAKEAAYENQLGMALSEEQSKILEDLNQKREEAKKSMLEASGGDTGKEVGSGSRAPGGIPAQNTAIDAAAAHGPH